MFAVMNIPTHALTAAHGSRYGVHGIYSGAALDNPDVVDKESSLFAMDAFLSLYMYGAGGLTPTRAKSQARPIRFAGHDVRDNEAKPTGGAVNSGIHDVPSVWLDRAVSAAVVASSWHRVTDVPNPVDARDAMDWAANDTACGMGLIALGHSGSDTFASMFAASFADLARATGRPMFDRMARLQAYNTKQPMDLNRTKGYFHRGFMSELFSFSVGYNVFTNENDGRGIGDPHWVPWVSANAGFGLAKWFECGG